MIETFVGGPLVAAAVAAAVPAPLAAGAGAAPPPQAATMRLARIASAGIRERMSSSSICLDGHVGDRVGTPADEPVLEPGDERLGDDRDDGQDEHRRVDAVGVEGALRRR